LAAEELALPADLPLAAAAAGRTTMRAINCISITARLINSLPLNMLQQTPYV